MNRPSKHNKINSTVVIANIEAELKKNNISFSPLAPIEMPPLSNDNIIGLYDIKDLLKYHDETFVNIAFNTILKRPPDIGGFSYYLESLRNGKLNKIEVIGRLRYSSEGRYHKVRIKGLLLAFCIQSSYKIFLIGHIVRIIVGIANLPRIIKNLETLDAAFSYSKIDTEKKIKGIYESKVDQANFELLKNNLSVKSLIIDDLRLLLETKASNIKFAAHEENIKNELDEILQIFNDHCHKEEEQEHIFDNFYVEFENKFRGAREDVKSRLNIYVPYIENLDQDIKEGGILDIGCGRGEWLEILNDRSLNAKGIDLNRFMVGACNTMGLTVTENDAISYLKKQESESLGAITAFHVIEHLSFEVMISLFDEALRVLKKGGIIIFETPNPENIIVGSCSFYSDPTHQRPLVPDVIQFIADQRGFKKTNIVRLHKRGEPEYSGSASIDEIVYKANMEQDFAIIGYKL